MRKFLAPYFSLKGRSSRREWWIIEILILFGFRLNEAAFEAMATGGGRFDLGEEAGQTWMILGATLLWLNIASNVRRLHDRGKSGWWSLIYLIPGMGQLWCFIECGFLKGQPHANRYGAPVGGVAPYQSLADQLKARLQTLNSAPAAPLGKTAGRRVSVLAASHRPTVQRDDGLSFPGDRKLGIALAIGAVVLFGLATLALTSGIPVAVAPATVNPGAPIFESIDKTLKP